MHSATKRIRGVGIGGLLLGYWVLAGCSVGPEEKPDDPEFAPVLGQMQPGMPRNPGSIYQSGYGVSLFTDRRALHVGDVVMVVLTEKTQSSKSAKTEVKKDTDIELTAPTVGGVAPSVNGYDLSAEAQQKRDFAGDASSKQSNSLSGTIAVTIADELPNGLLVVRGEKWLTLNKGDEFIRIKGLIRPEDIEPDNTISSQKIADARISYGGSGDLAQSNDMGWLSRVFNGRFWPF